MDFEFSEEQQLLKDSIEGLLGDKYDFEHRKKILESADGWSREIWKQYAELGILGLPFAEEHGGINGGPVETMIVMSAMGNALALEPYLPTVVLAGGFLRRFGTDAQKNKYLPAIAEGKITGAFAHTERQSRYDLFDVKTTAKPSGNGFTLDGQKSVVLNGDQADFIVVTARVSGNSRDRDGLGLFIVDAKANGVSRRGYRTVDGLTAAEIQLSGVSVDTDQVIGKPGAAYPLIEQVVDDGIAALCGEAVGVLAALTEATTDYIRTRKQFGVTIGSFQVLQHRNVEMLIAAEQAKSMTMLATMMVNEADAITRHKTMSAAKTQIGRSAQFVGEQAIQLHGGIGMTMELKVGHWFKRATAIDIQFGDADYHLERFGNMGGFESAA
ncbi:MAG: acyl-CoA dehydrogenase family protein [Xanthobacteraceae bacterium]|nr:acyl-CoA dehydrogenase family protein [Xanthobacteraceae bacterium]QYK45202.1 MAG: acyl-CoA dehydrogenase family protein [Xanthobacteraceae bacterium]